MRNRYYIMATIEILKDRAETIGKQEKRTIQARILSLELELLKMTHDEHMAEAAE